MWACLFSCIESLAGVLVCLWCLLFVSLLGWLQYQQQQQKNLYSELPLCRSRIHPAPSEIVHRKALVLDLDETLVHSSLKTPPSYHFKINVFVEYLWRDFYVIKRPALEEFLDFVGRNYQVYIFTAGVREYAEPVIEKIDTHKWVVGRFFRDSCVTRTGFFVKDLTNIRMDLSSSIIIDNQPVSYSLNKENAVPIDHFFDDPRDLALQNLIPFLDTLRYVHDVRSILSLRLLNLVSL